MNDPKIISRPTVLGDAKGLHLPPVGHKPPNLQRTRVINFDNVADGTVVDSLYASSGVHFASLTTQPASRGSAYARTLQISHAASGMNVLSLTQAPGWSGAFFDARQGAVEASFDQLQRMVSVMAMPMDFVEALTEDDNRPFMEAFDSAGKYLGRALTTMGRSDPSYFMHWQPITFTSPSRNIKTVRLSSQAHGSGWVYTAFDNLSFQVDLLRPLP